MGPSSRPDYTATRATGARQSAAPSWARGVLGCGRTSAVLALRVLRDILGPSVATASSPAPCAVEPDRLGSHGLKLPGDGYRGGRPSIARDTRRHPGLDRDIRLAQQVRQLIDGGLGLAGLRARGLGV